MEIANGYKMCSTCMHESVCMHKEEITKVMDEINEVKKRHDVAGTWPKVLCSPIFKCTSFSAAESHFNYR